MKQKINIINISNTEKYKKFLDDNFKAAVKKFKDDVRYISFDIDSLSYELSDGVISIADKSQHIELTEDNINNTIIFHSEITLSETPEVYGLINYLIARNFYVVNNISNGLLVSDKYDTYELLKKYKIPQPETVLVTANELDEDANNETMAKIVKPIYGNTNDKNEYVVKILDGHGGTGVFTIDYKNLLSVMQTLSKISPTTKFIIQDKKDATDGDIRVHVFTIGDEQFVLCALKRHKLKNDFRSNISLGATVSDYKLTDKQLEICLKAAKISGLIWCGVDLMECTDGSNYVLELNAGAGGLIDYMDYTHEPIFEPLVENILNILKIENDEED